MIPRYLPKDFEKLWSAETQYQTWYRVEMAACRAMQEEGLIPPYAVMELEASGIDMRIEVSRVEEIEKETRHDVIAFLRHMEDLAGDHSRWMHVGMTSSDLVDTSLAILLCQASDMLDVRMGALLKSLAALARKHANTLTIGRSHGMHAEPTTFGLVLAGHLEELKRGRTRLRQAREEISVGKLSGAVGNYAHGSPLVELRAMGELGLRPEPVSTQVVARDRHAAFAATVSLVGSGIERLAQNIRHLSRSEVGEVSESFSKGQKGSSAMPHKRNPIACENLCGCARLLRGYSLSVQEDVPLWHERDISHSAVERVALADSTSLLGYMLDRMKSIVEGLVVHVDVMAHRVVSTNVWASEAVLLALVAAGVRRQEAYGWVQECALGALDANPSGSTFAHRVSVHPLISDALSPAVLTRCFDSVRQVRHAPAAVEASCRGI